MIAGGASHTNDYLKEIKNIIKENENIIMTGFVQGIELEELYSNCYLYCLPSDVEGMPLSLLEAMSYGCTCLVSDIDENVQVLGKYGYTFKKSDVKDLTNKLNLVLKETNNNKNKIADYILNNYSWENVKIKTEELYERNLL